MKNDCYAERAKIFMPFDALKGFKEALKEKEKAIQKATDSAANSLQVFSDKLMLASKFLDEVGKYMNAMQSATDQIFNTLEAANRVTVDEYGNYTKQKGRIRCYRG